MEKDISKERQIELHNTIHKLIMDISKSDDNIVRLELLEILLKYHIGIKNPRT